MIYTDPSAAEAASEQKRISGCISSKPEVDPISRYCKEVRLMAMLGRVTGLAMRTHKRRSLRTAACAGERARAAEQQTALRNRSRAHGLRPLQPLITRKD